MSAIPQEIAYEILSLPTFATVEEIIERYKTLAIRYYPESNNNTSFAVQQFKQLNEALLVLLKPDRHQDHLKLVDLYQLFHSIFFTNQEHRHSEGDDEDADSVATELAYNSATEREIEQAAVNASRLILEEEQEKLKAQRKKDKKKRRKERKKQQKADNGNTSHNASEPQTSQEPKDDIKMATEEKSDEKSSDSEEAIDTESAFVAVIAKKHKNIPIVEPKKAENPVTKSPLLPNETKEDPAALVLKSRQMASMANELASAGRYLEAVSLFSDSIKLDPSDHRFYGNRSYCYERVGDFERALKDAEKSVALCPSWPKGYYRKGRALLGLKRYPQAEKCFVEVLKLDNDCEDAISELHKVKVLQIMELGYSMEDAETALAKYSSVQESIESLLAGNLSKMKTTDDIDDVEIFISDEESDFFFNQVSQPTTRSPQYDIKMDPRNPENHSSLWIGNVQPDVTEKKIYNLFSKYGELISVKVMPEKFCAFVNYKNRNAPGRAMQAYQGLELSGANLIIRFPNLPGEAGAKKKSSVAQDSAKPKTDECYYWRTTGCIYGENCRNRHVKEHKGIDKKKWHIVP